MRHIFSNNPLHRRLLAYPNTVGVGYGPKFKRGELSTAQSIVVMVKKKLPLSMLKPMEIIPSTAAGLLTDVMEVGEIKALQERTDQWRPAPGGVSIGHYKITAGTLGCVVDDKETGQKLILSNNHVLANSNDAEIGDLIYQPGIYDGGVEEIAKLERFIPINFNTAPPSCDVANAVASMVNLVARFIGSSHRLTAHFEDQEATNLVDAAVARPIKDEFLRDDILEIGEVTSRVDPELGMAVKKSGRTTGLTTGTILVLDATVTVSYGEGKQAVFENQIVSGGMSSGGDSGSLLVNEDNKAVGLLFAGSDQATIFSPIAAVCELLGVDFYAA